MVKTKRLLSMVLSLALMLTMCMSFGISSSAEDASDDEKVVTVNSHDGDPGTLDPFAAATSPRKFVLEQIYDRLLEEDEDGNMVGVLAKDYVKDGRNVTVTLYDNIYDTAGNHFTAYDAQYCFEKAKENAVSYALVFESFEATDDYTLEITANSDDVNVFESNIVYLYMVTQQAYEDSGENMAIQPVTTGPYMVESYETGATVTLVKNEDYWQSEENRASVNQMQNVDKIIYTLVTETSQVIVGLETHEMDAAMPDYTQAARFEEGGESEGANVATETVPTWGGNGLFFNESDDSIFKDNVALRKAILYAIDREAIIDVVFEGNAINTCCYGQLRYPDANPEWADEDYFNYNPELAQQYFEESGYSAGELTLDLLYAQSSYYDNVADLIQAYLGVLGINVNVNGLETATYSEAILDPTEWDLAFIGKGGSGSITVIWNANLNRNNYSADGSYCAGFINDDKLQELVEIAGNAETNSIETCDDVQQYLNEMAYNMMLYIETKCVCYNTEKIVEPFVNSDARFIPGAFTYVWNS